MSQLSSRQGWFLALTAALVPAVSVGLLLGQNSQGQDKAATTRAVQTSNDNTPAKTPAELRHDPKVSHANELSKAFREAAAVATPSVVTIRSHQNAKKVKGIAGQTPFHSRGGNGENPFKGTPFEDMLPQMPGFGGGDGEGFQSPQRDGIGSGVIIDRTGLIMTNNHVVEDADTVTVHFADGREYKATEIKCDPHSDLAIVRIKADGDLPAAHLGDSDDLEIGDWVIAIGQPFEQENTVTAGIISGKGRELSSTRTKFLQTDAAINPGNSGGPLLNLAGEVVGINTAIASNSGGYQGIGFAIPINQAKWVTEQLVNKGSVSRGYLGVGIGQVTNDLAKTFGMENGTGALVSEVYPNTPAAEAKMQEGDIIMSFAGQTVHNPKEVQELVEKAPIDKVQNVEVLRDGKKVMLSLTVKTLPEKFGMTEPMGKSPAKEAPTADAYKWDDLGIEVADMTSEEADAYHGYSGVMIKKVSPDGMAAGQGLRPGLLIRKVGNTDVKNVKDFEAAVKNESVKNGVRLMVRTPQGNRFIAFQAQ